MRDFDEKDLNEVTGGTGPSSNHPTDHGLGGTGNPGVTDSAEDNDSSGSNTGGGQGHGGQGQGGFDMPTG